MFKEFDPVDGDQKMLVLHIAENSAREDLSFYDLSNSVMDFRKMLAEKGQTDLSMRAFAEKCAKDGLAVHYSQVRLFMYLDELVNLVPSFDTTVNKSIITKAYIDKVLNAEKNLLKVHARILKSTPDQTNISEDEAKSIFKRTIAEYMDSFNKEQLDDILESACRKLSFDMKHPIEEVKKFLSYALDPNLEKEELQKQKDLQKALEEDTLNDGLDEDLENDIDEPNRGVFKERDNLKKSLDKFFDKFPNLRSILSYESANSPFIANYALNHESIAINKKDEIVFDYSKMTFGAEMLGLICGIRMAINSIPMAYAIKDGEISQAQSIMISDILMDTTNPNDSLSEESLALSDSMKQTYTKQMYAINTLGKDIAEQLDIHLTDEIIDGYALLNKVQKAANKYYKAILLSDSEETELESNESI